MVRLLAWSSFTILKQVSVQAFILCAVLACMHLVCSRLNEPEFYFTLHRVSNTYISNQATSAVEIARFMFAFKRRSKTAATQLCICM